MKTIFTILSLILLHSAVSAQCGVYYVRNTQPWSTPAYNDSALVKVFGVGNFTVTNYSASPATIFASNVCTVVLEGSELNAIALNSFLSANITTIQNWVAGGKRLFINAAPNEGNSINCGFSSTIINYVTPDTWSSTGTFSNTNHPILQGPFLPTAANATGSSYAHAVVSGSGLTQITVGNATAQNGSTAVLAGKKWGLGYVLFGTITNPKWHSPAPQVYNNWYNTFYFLNTTGIDGLITNFGGSTICAGANISVNYSSPSLTQFNSGNTFTVQLSNAKGLFTNPTVIGTLNSTQISGIVTCAVPANLPAGSQYRVRVVSSNPRMEGGLNAFALTRSIASTWYLDADNDGWYVQTVQACSSPGTGWRSVLPTGGLGDCNDNNNQVWRSATLFIDADGDGYDNGTQVVCYGATVPSGYRLTTLGSDCNDNNNQVWRTATLYIDADSDGYDNGTQTVCYGASIPSGYSETTLGSDCDDSNPAINPTTVWYLDADGDGYYVGSGITQCASPGMGYRYEGLIAGNDCDDLNPNIWQTVQAYLDNDEDGYTASFNAICIGATLPSNYTYTSLGEDCDDADPDAWQSANLYIDLDEDGYDNGVTFVCFGSEPPQGYSFNTLGSDCNDNNRNIKPGAAEICGNGIDDNCNGEIDEACCPKFSTLSAISGPSNHGCDASTGIFYSINPVTNADGYNWTTTGGIIIAGGQGTTSITVDYPAGFTTGTIRVRAYNYCSVSSERALTIRSTPSGTPGAISGASTNICPSTTGSYSITPVANTDSYEWAVVGSGVSIQSGQGTTNVILQFTSSFTSAILQVRAVNSCGTSGWRSLAISSGVDALGIPGAIQGSTQGCPLATETYSIPAIFGATNYIWRTAGGIVIEENGSHIAEMSFPANFISGSIFVRAANACGQTKEVRLNVTGLTRTPGAVSGQTTLVCANTSQSYSIAPVAGATSYQWSATGDINLQSENGTEATFNFGPSFASGTIEVQAVNACGASAVRRLTVRSNVPARPGIISGLTAGLCAEESAVYSINPVNFAESYLWTFTGDLDVTAGQGSTSATYLAGTNFHTGQVSVQAQNVCGVSSARVLNVRSTPALPGSIAGPGPDVPKGTEGLIYSINPVASATGYLWTTTNGLILGSVSGTSVEVDIPADFSRGAIQVQAVNACGEGSMRSRSLRGVEVLPFAGGRAVVTNPLIKVYPNPAKDKVIVQGSGITEIHLYDIAGKLLQAHRYQDAYQEEIKLGYPQGIYIILVFGAGWQSQHKVVVQ
jgi:hypothetical protein